TAPPNSTSMTGGSGVGVWVKGSSAVVVILVGEGCKGTPTRGQAPGSLGSSSERAFPREQEPHMRNRGDRQQGRSERPRSRLHVPEEQQAAHPDAGAPEGEHGVDDPPTEPCTEREGGKHQHRHCRQDGRPGAHGVHRPRGYGQIKPTWADAE